MRIEKPKLYQVDDYVISLSRVGTLSPEEGGNGTEDLLINIPSGAIFAYDPATKILRVLEPPRVRFPKNIYYKIKSFFRRLFK